MPLGPKLAACGWRSYAIAKSAIGPAPKASQRTARWNRHVCGSGAGDVTPRNAVLMNGGGAGH